MKTQVSLLAAVMTVFMAAGSAFAQQAAPAASAPPDLTPVANPVSGFVKAGVARYGKNMVAAAELMPAEKYSFKPSPEMNSFGHLAMHIAQANNTFCAKISGQTAPDLKIAETDSKDKLVAAIKDSFAFCTTALANVDDSKLGEQFVLFGNRPISRGGALVALGGSWTDHYATQAGEEIARRATRFRRRALQAHCVESWDRRTRSRQGRDRFRAPLHDTDKFLEES